MIIQIIFLGIISLIVAAAAFTATLYVHAKITGCDNWHLFHTHSDVRQAVEPAVKRRIGEILMVPCKSAIAERDFVAVVVVQKLENDYYIVQTFHETPKRWTVHSAGLVTREEAFGNSRIDNRA